MVVVVVDGWVWFGFEGQTPPPRCGTHGVDIEARDSAFERTPVVFFF